MIVINGPSGVGKSALALHWLDSELDRLPHGALYAVLTESTGHPVAAEDVLGQFLRALGVLPDRVPGAMSERVALFRSMTARRSIAVLLDDAYSAGQVRTLLPASGTSVVVVTSRRPLAGLLPEGAVMMTTEPLDPAAAADLIERHVGESRLDAERAATEALINRCEGLPIALAVAAALMVLRPRRSIAELVAELDNERRRLDVLSVDEDLSVRTTFDVSYRLLSPAAAHAYQALGMHPGSLVTTELLAAACSIIPAYVATAIDALVDAQVLRELAPHIYHCHDLLRTHARTIAYQMVSAEDRATMERQVFEWHLFAAQAASRTVMPARRSLEFDFTSRYDLPVGIDDHNGALAWLERHRLDLAAVVRAAVTRGDNEIAYKLADAMQPLFILHKHNREAVEVNGLAVTAASRWGNWPAEANMRKRLARAHLRLEELDDARQHIDQLLHDAQSRDDHRAIASGLKTLGGLHARRGEHEQSVLMFEEATRLMRDIGSARSLALALIDESRALLDLRCSEQAAVRLAEAVSLLGALDPPDPYNTARATRLLAQSHLLQGEPQPARRLLDDALALLQQVGADHELAATHHALADVHDLSGDPDRAGHHRAQAENILRPDG
ncbi:MAG: tetratricopeptide repeat protein [Actinophytocola sp.]|uniref:tetratricopeptide repeat protein n=1 Tax=Actinophytocola sp. TaxID=1872138 RepID=UPI003C77858A